VNVNTILVGNKSDCQERRSVAYEEGYSLAKNYNIRFFETSAKFDANIENVFNTIGTEVMNRLIHEKEKSAKEATEKLESEKSIHEALTLGKKEWRRSKIMIDELGKQLWRTVFWDELMRTTIPR
jgi:GTPase SAR1 family protein